MWKKFKLKNKILERERERVYVCWCVYVSILKEIAKIPTKAPQYSGHHGTVRHTYVECAYAQ